MQAYRWPTVQILLCKARPRTKAQMFHSELFKRPEWMAHGMSQADPSLHRKPASQKPVLWPQFAHTWSGLRHFTQRCALFTTGWASLRLCDA